MERATKVILVEGTPPVPRRKPRAPKVENNILRDQKEALRLSPDSLVVDNSYPRETYEESLRSAKSAAYVVNSGERKAWPRDTYYAIWRTVEVTPDEGDEDSGKDNRVVQLLIGLRSHIKPEWEAAVNRAGSRLSKTENNADDQDEVDEDSPANPFDNGNE